MIRLALFAGALALPVQGRAQDFRGLLPGMQTADLARLGEPFDLRSEAGLTLARYPLPFERQLQVVHGGGRILSIGLGAFDVRIDPPESDGLTVGVSSLDETLAVAGSEGFTFDDESPLTMMGDIPTGWTLYFDLAEHPDLLLELAFYRPGVTLMDPADAAQLTNIPRDTILAAATFYHTDFVTAHPEQFGTTRIDRPGAAPFATPLDEAFPRLRP